MEQDDVELLSYRISAAELKTLLILSEILNLEIYIQKIINLFIF